MLRCEVSKNPSAIVQSCASKGMGALGSVRIILRFTSKPPLGSPIAAAECHEGCTPTVSTVALAAIEGHQSQKAEKRSEQEPVFEQ